MDEKCVKTVVNLNDTVYNEKTECPIDVDLNLPDYCGDIARIFKCRAVARVASKSLNGRNLSIDGAVGINILYCSDSGKLSSFNYQYPFAKNLELPEEAVDSDVNVIPKCEYINCRAVTERKIDIHGAVSLKITAEKARKTEIISDIDDESVEQLRSTVPATAVIGYSEKYMLIEEDIQINQGQPAVSQILRFEAKPFVRECRIINDKVVAKGELAVSVLYESENSSGPQTVKTAIPFSQIIDIEGVTEDCLCDTKVQNAYLDLKIKPESSNIKGFELTAKLLITVNAYCGNDIPVILDAYSRKCEATVANKRVSFDKITERVNDTFLFKQNIETDFSISSVLDLWCDIQSSTCKIADGNMIINGNLIVGMIILSEENEMHYDEKSLEFEYKYPVKDESDSLSCKPETDVLSVGFTLMGSKNIELRTDIAVNAAVYSHSSATIVTDFNVNSAGVRNNNKKSAMIIYFADDEERLWDVAKRYNASVGEITKINNINNDDVIAGKMLLIP